MTIERMKLSRLGAFYRRGGSTALFPLVFALLLAFFGSITKEELRLLETDGVDTTATVLSSDEYTIRSRSRTSGNTNRTTHYRVEVQFDGPDDRTLRQRVDVGMAFQSRVSEGDEIPIRYVRQDPSIINADPKFRSRGDYWVTAGTLLMLTWFAGMIWHYWRESAKIYRAVNHGEVRDASVTGHVNASNSQLDHTRKDHVPRYMLKWHDSRDRFGMGGSLTEKELVKYPKGTVIVTYTDPVSGETFWEGQI